MGGSLADWRSAALPEVSAEGWSVAAAREGLIEVARLRCVLEAAEAVLVAVVQQEAGRDTACGLVRATGMPARDARRAARAAAVVTRLPPALAALAGGSVTSAHLAALAAVKDDAAAGALLVVAPSQSADEFARTVRRHLAAAEGKGTRGRQRAGRRLSFFRTDDGGVGLRAVLPALEGERVRAAIEQECDSAWRRAHPDRAAAVGGDEDEPRERRLADALVRIVTGAAGGSGRAALVVVLDEPTWTATVAGGEPLTAADVAELALDPRTELYAAARSSSGSILHFGRSRRFASALQKLALVARDGGWCTWPGCDQPWYRCDADHVEEWERGGATDLPNLRLLCTSVHHPHRHEAGLEPTGPDPPARAA